MNVEQGRRLLQLVAMDPLKWSNSEAWEAQDIVASLLHEAAVSESELIIRGHDPVIESLVNNLQPTSINSQSEIPNAQFQDA